MAHSQPLGLAFCAQQVRDFHQIAVRIAKINRPQRSSGPSSQNRSEFHFKPKFGHPLAPVLDGSIAKQADVERTGHGPSGVRFIGLVGVVQVDLRLAKAKGQPRASAAGRDKTFQLHAQHFAIEPAGLFDVGCRKHDMVDGCYYWPSPLFPLSVPQFSKTDSARGYGTLSVRLS